MSQQFLALLLLGVLLLGVHSGVDAGDRKGQGKCKKPNGKIGQTKVVGCGSNICKKNGGGGAVWEACPQPATREELKSTREEIKEEIKSTREEIKEEINSTREEIKSTREEIKEEIILTREEIKEEIRSTSEEIKEEINSTREEINSTREEIKSTREEIKEEINLTRKEIKEEIKSTSEEIKEEINSTREELKSTREEIKEEINLTREEIKEEIKSTREELKEEIKSTREEINSTREEIKEEIKSTREEIKEEIKETTEEIKEEIKETREEIKETRKEIKETREEIKSVHHLLLDVYKRLGFGLNVVFELKEEFNIAKGFQLGTLPYLGKEYKIKFEWFITGFGSSWQSIILFTRDGNRIPGVWLLDNNQIEVHFAAESKGGKKVFPFAAKTGKWMKMEISQYLLADNKVEFDLKIDGASYWTTPNSEPQAYTDVKMYSGDPWFNALNGKIRNVQVQTLND